MKSDDIYLDADDEKEPICGIRDNCVQENIEMKPNPIVELQNERDMDGSLLHFKAYSVKSGGNSSRTMKKRKNTRILSLSK